MKAAYPIVMSQGAEYIIVYVPDFNINTQGTDYADAIEMTRDAIGLMGIDMEDEKNKFLARLICLPYLKSTRKTL